MPAQQRDPRTCCPVDRSGAKVVGGGVVPSPPQAPAGSVRGSPWLPARKTTTGAVRAKELTTEYRLAVAVPTVRCGSSGIRISRTTLGNGYLGSRIDEERSEMRYLV